MSLVHTIPDATSFVLSLCDICVVGSVAGCVLVAVESVLVLGFRGVVPRGPAPHSAVTILKPLHGSEPGLSGRLAAFSRQDHYGPVQVVCGAQDFSCPAVAVVRAMQPETADRPIELHLDPRRHGGNRKVSNLINMLPHVRHDTILLSDSDIVVGPDYVRTIAAILADPRVGAVTCLYHGISDDGLWARLSSLAINSHFLPQAITAITIKVTKPCFGATIGMRRAMLERIGGFGRFADELADDYAIGAAVQAAGHEVVAAPFVVGHCCFEDSLRLLMQRQLRVARTIRSIDPIGYAGTIITHPWPLALIGMLSGSTFAALVAVVALTLRVTLYGCVERRFGLPREDYWLIPLQDLIAFAVYVASYFGATVQWRGASYRVATDGSLVEEDLSKP